MWNYPGFVTMASCTPNLAVTLDSDGPLVSSMDNSIQISIAGQAFFLLDLKKLRQVVYIEGNGRNKMELCSDVQWPSGSRIIRSLPYAVALTPIGNPNPGALFFMWRIKGKNNKGFANTQSQKPTGVILAWESYKEPSHSHLCFCFTICDAGWSEEREFQGKGSSFSDTKASPQRSVLIFPRVCYEFNWHHSQLPRFQLRPWHQQSSRVVLLAFHKCRM